jgi:hypothetical protein
MGAVKRTFIDPATGDYVEMFGGETARGWRRSPFGKRWMKMSYEAHIQLAKTPGIFTNDFRVFHLLMPTIHDGNIVYINQSSMGKELGMPASVVNRSIRNLIAKGVIERSDSSNGRLYRLNPHFAWYGSDNGGHTRAVMAWDKARLQ